MSYRRRRGTDSSMAASLSRIRLEPLAAGAPKRAWNFSHNSISSLLHGGCAKLMRLPAAQVQMHQERPAIPAALQYQGDSRNVQGRFLCAL